MNTNLSFSPPAQLETECLVLAVLDHGEKDKPDARVTSNDNALQDAAAELISSGEVTGKIFETVATDGLERMSSSSLRYSALWGSFGPPGESVRLIPELCASTAASSTWSRSRP